MHPYLSEMLADQLRAQRLERAAERRLARGDARRRRRPGPVATYPAARFFPRPATLVVPAGPTSPAPTDARAARETCCA